MRLAAAALTLLLNTAAWATEIEGIKLADSVRSAAGSNLVLNGAGVRVRLVFNVYVAALYLPAKSSDAEAILRGDQPLRFTMQMLRDLSAEQINSSTTDALRETLTAEERRPLDARMARFNSIFSSMREVKEGTRVTLDYAPAVGTIVSINDEEKDRIPGADFRNALMRVWLGARARDPDLRRALLGMDAK